MLPDFHDGLLTSLTVAEGGATLTLSHPGGRDWTIELQGVRHLRADNFREGNIIAELEIITGIAPPRSQVEVLAERPHEGAAQTFHDEHRAYVDHLVEQVSAGQLMFLSLNPSYGCELLVVCENVRASEVI